MMILFTKINYCCSIVHCAVFRLTSLRLFLSQPVTKHPISIAVAVLRARIAECCGKPENLLFIFFVARSSRESY